MKTPRTPEEIKRQRQAARDREIHELRFGMKRHAQKAVAKSVNPWLNRHIADATGTDHDYTQGFHYEDPAIAKLIETGAISFDNIPTSGKTAKPRTIAAANAILSRIAQEKLAGRNLGVGR